jgi:hypothetical protein
LKLDPASTEKVEISPRFRRTIEERIARLEQDASFDESQLAYLSDSDHRRRQLRLVAAQRAEALRMRLFLDRTGIRMPSPLISVQGPFITLQRKLSESSSGI